MLNFYIFPVKETILLIVHIISYISFSEFKSKCKLFLQLHVHNLQYASCNGPCGESLWQSFHDSNIKLWHHVGFFTNYTYQSRFILSPSKGYINQKVIVYRILPKVNIFSGCKSCKLFTYLQHRYDRLFSNQMQLHDGIRIVNFN